MELKINSEIELCLPPLDPDTYGRLRENMKLNGFINAFPIIVWQGENTIVDGHHRYKACQELGIEPVVVEMPFESEEDAILFALEHQDSRRNLTETQKAEIAVKCGLLREQSAAKRREASKMMPDRHQNKKGRAAEIVAEEMKISPRTINRVKRVHDQGSPKLQQMMTTGELSAFTAERFVKGLPLEEQEAIIDKGGAEAVKKYVSEEANQERTEEANQERTEEANQERTEEEDDLVLWHDMRSGEISSFILEYFLTQVPIEKQREIRKGGPEAVRKYVAELRAKAREQEAIKNGNNIQFVVHRDVILDDSDEDGRREVIESVYGTGCMMPNALELFCQDCRWSFRILLPPPTDIIYCPFCRGENIINVPIDWNYRYESANAIKKQQEEMMQK